MHSPIQKCNKGWDCLLCIPLGILLGDEHVGTHFLMSAEIEDGWEGIYLTVRSLGVVRVTVVIGPSILV